MTLPRTPHESSTDCRSHDGITVGLVDSLMAIARVLRPRCEEPLKQHYGVARSGEGVPLADGHEAVIQALQDLAQDEDVAALMKMAKRFEGWKRAAFPECFK